MFQKILIPLDGSKLAECVLPFLDDLVKNSESDVILISVTESVPGYRPVKNHSQPGEERLMPEAVGKKERQAEKYLNRIAKGLTKKGFKVQTRVLLGNPAQEITYYARYHGCDLVVMASHGRTGPSRWAFGSVADKVFRAICTPVLMIRGPGCIPDI